MVNSNLVKTKVKEMMYLEITFYSLIHHSLIHSLNICNMAYFHVMLKVEDIVLYQFTEKRI
jgi:hypothetical protein